MAEQAAFDTNQRDIFPDRPKGVLSLKIILPPVAKESEVLLLGLYRRLWATIVKLIVYVRKKLTTFPLREQRSVFPNLK
jgi:hypothetical protein